MKKATLLFTILTLLFSLCITAQNNVKVTIVDRPDKNIQNNNYITNKAPLQPLSFIKLPVGDVKPEGWTLKLLELQKMV